MYKEFLQLNYKKGQEHNKAKWAKDLSRYFTKEDIQVINNLLNRVSHQENRLKPHI